jgi:hypothetical protein
MFAGDRPDSVLSSNFFDSQFSQVGLKVKSMCDRVDRPHLLSQLLLPITFNRKR